jgi:hypothetical protein
MEQEKVLLTWTAKSRPFNKNGPQTRQVLVVLGILVAVVLIFAREWMLLLVIAAGVFYYYATTHVPPENMEYRITNKGVWAFGRAFMWWEFSRWWWAEKWTTKLIGLDLKTGVMGQMFIPVEGVKPEEVEKVMNKYLLFETPKETTAERMGKWMVEKFPLENKI